MKRDEADQKSNPVLSYKTNLIRLENFNKGFDVHLGHHSNASRVLTFLVVVLKPRFQRAKAQTVLLKGHPSWIIPRKEKAWLITISQLSDFAKRKSSIM